MDRKIINGQDHAGNNSYIMVGKDKQKNKILILSAEEGSDVVLTIKQAKELITAIKEYINK